MLQTKEHNSTLSFSIVFTFEFAFESFKVFGGVSPPIWGHNQKGYEAVVHGIQTTLDVRLD
jgi:hypothetical protein